MITQKTVNIDLISQKRILRRKFIAVVVGVLTYPLILVVFALTPGLDWVYANFIAVFFGSLLALPFLLVTIILYIWIVYFLIKGKSNNQ